MSIKGNSQGNVFTHNYFHSSIRKILEVENFDDTVAGITVLTLTAFMIESYLNYAFDLIFDCQNRVNEKLESTDNMEILKISKTFSKEIKFEERISISYGFKEQLIKLIQSLESNLGKKKSKKLKKLVSEIDSKQVLFSDIDSKLHISPKIKFAAILDTITNDADLRSNYIEIVNNIFESRNMLAHGRTEFLCQEFEIKQQKTFDSSKVPSIKALWQEQCSLVNANVLYIHGCEIIEYISNNAFDEDKPFLFLSSQVSSLPLG